jgi:hypothetical protein
MDNKNYERRLSIFKRKILCRIYGPICEGGQWQKRYGRELEELYNEPNTVNVIKSSRLRWGGHVVRMVENNLPKILWTNPEGHLGHGGPKSRCIDGVQKDARKLGYMNWQAMPTIEVAGDICLRRPRPTQDCRVDDDDDDSCAERVIFNNRWGPGNTQVSQWHVSSDTIQPATTVNFLGCLLTI